MGLIKAAFGSAGGVLADQWKEYFYCDALETDVIAAKGQRRTSKRSSNKRGNENIITSGSVIAVADGQCMIIVEQGKVVDICAEPGEYTYDAATEPSVFCGDLSKNIPAVLKNIGKRFTFGGEAPMDQRIYYFNTKELIGNKYGTPSPVPFRVVDTNVGLDVDISIRCFGEYSYRVTNPVLFYTNVCGNVDNVYERSELDGQLKSELLTALQPAFARISEMGVRYSALPGHTAEIAAALNEILSEKWKDLRGIEIVSFGVSSVKASDEDEQMIKELQRNAAFRNPTMAAAHMVGAQAAAMQSAAANEGAGPAMAFMGMNMAQGAGGANAQQLFQMGQQAQPVPPQPASASAPADGWICACGNAGNTGKFCTECGAKKPDADGWTCPSCGTVNKGKFCSECGAKKPAGVPQYRCDKCGWEPEDPAHPPKFCPECGDPFDDGDIK
ncbi:SPFH domain-containing protein [Butyricicoccus sp.]|uniref:SPFH domain-containing protein n=1 Tax=Butyricicoccus sp. TaxID=2049021 RepID=UPI003F18E0BA